ncbi:MAG: response regulator [Tepidisphaeraceae bacterium]|jgi:DNA-binding response OmpR family regulator
MARRQAILVVEGDPMLLGRLVSLLNTEGFAAEGALTGIQGVELFRQHEPTLVVAELDLPDMAGLELLTAIRRASAGTPVLFLAGADDTRDVAAVLHGGAAGIVPRPLGDTSVFLHDVHLAFSHAHLLEENDRLRRQLAADEQSHAEQIRLQDRLFKAEKATAIGRLASSIAHDFNNVLTVLGGFAHCLKAASSPGTIVHDYVERIADAAGRASDMMRQLSEFGRSQMSIHVSTDINRIVGEVARLLSRTLDKRITVHTAANAEKSRVLADATRLQLALLNLGVSAGGAMPGGGDLTCETRNIRVEAAAPAADIRALPPGEYIEVAIRDSGGNMDEEAARKAIDPLCNGKGVGYATESGLGGVQNCVREHHGELSCRVRPGEHRAIILRLPLADTGENAGDVAAASAPPRAAGHILLADDEEMIRAFIEQCLTGMGHKVTTVADGVSAVEFYARHADSIDLVILDQNMPRLAGPEAFRKIKAINPAAKVVLCTGLDDTDAARQFTEAGGTGVLSKPFRLADLSSLMAGTIGVK